MILKSVLAHVMDAQKANLDILDTGLKRETLDTLPNITSHALIVSGIRRCGKSTLLYQLLKEKYSAALYLNFEDTRLYDFEPNDFTRLDSIIKDSETNVLFFDEIQIIDRWETYVRQKLDEGCKVVITGSNASLLSRELGTKLTGRHITKELFPFSYNEFKAFRKTESTEETVLAYLHTGGFPEYVKFGLEEVLHHLFEDILIRDIAVRYGVRDVKTLQRLALYLVSNVGKLVTGNRLKSLFEVGSTSTIMDYLSHLEYTYLFHFIPKFSSSARKQLVNPRKIYAADTGMVNANSGSFSDDFGLKFENMVFLHLRRDFREIYYFSEKGECDFVVVQKGTVIKLVQVCYELSADNLDRELDGLFEAMDFFKLKEGSLITLHQSDLFERNGKVVKAIPSYDFLG
ncbi:ATP-binding protein [Dyadobacter sp. CY323]|uniref:ATP-binding protein n=1 Tax=Dyadobacter sp. CY323 TaxID=2907302 RepID=UPI001F1679BB|nr:ATP-binding protein [Dyadobacter sp. CY323]MCE6992432.1 ATP-binding protein [Dyadobacter sp. CY323]